LARFKEPIWWPDAMDVLVTSKNHDVKRARMARPRLEHWVYGLVSLQTMGGFAGRDTYGIARMNGGFGSRSGVGFAPGLSLAARHRRDVAIASEARLALRGADLGYPADGGLALLWMEPWEGANSLHLTACDPLFLEVCRRVRLVHDGLRIGARSAPTKVARLAAADRKGDTGDPWTAVRVRDGAALTVASTGFTYDLTRRLMLGGGDFLPGAAGRLTENDGDGTVFTATVLARGQGETNGFHERRLPVPTRVRRMLGQPESRDRLSLLSARRVERAATVRKSILHPALCALLQAGAERLDYRDRRTDPWTSALDQEIDRVFFEQLWADAEADDVTADARWAETLHRLARTQLALAMNAAPIPVARRYRAIAAAERVFAIACRKHLDLSTTETSTA
jgi:CRISPR system Cascade subunit CasA